MSVLFLILRLTALIASLGAIICVIGVFIELIRGNIL